MKFKQVQHQFVAYLRSPDQSEKPVDVDQERLDVYRELLFNNVSGFVSSAFPVLTTFYLEQQWQVKVRQFFQDSSMQSPYFLDIAESFLNWLQHQQSRPEDPPFLLELAHYEWIELYLATAHRQAELAPLTQIESTQLLAVDELALLLAYQFPVSQISVAFRPDQPLAEPSLLLVYRDLADDIKFMAINQLSATLLQLLINTPGQSVAALTATLQTLAPQLTKDAIHEGAQHLLHDLAKKGVIRAFQAA